MSAQNKVSENKVVRGTHYPTNTMSKTKNKNDRPTRNLENQLKITKGFKHISGVDECGRGSLVGVVTVCAVVLPEFFEMEGINDNKKLTRKQIELLYHKLVIYPGLLYAIVHGTEKEIDNSNILAVTLDCMGRAVQELENKYSMKIDHTLVDGNQVPPILKRKCTTIVNGDSLCTAISVASIIGKHTRINLMKEYHKKYPLYGFDKNDGYGVKKHREAIETYGPCEIHRKTFNPVKTLLLAASTHNEKKMVNTRKRTIIGSNDKQTSKKSKKNNV